MTARNPEITPELAARALAGSFPGDLGVELLAGDTLHGVGELLHAGRRTQVWEVRIRKEDPGASGGDERLAANFVCTQMVLAPAS